MQTIRKFTFSFLLLSTLFAALPALAAEPASAAGVVNINTADVTQLSLLPRVGPALAQRIIDFRKENGEFKKAEDLILVRGIGEKTFRMLQSFLTLKGKTTLERKVRKSDLPKAEPQSDAQPENQSDAQSETTES